MVQREHHRVRGEELEVGLLGRLQGRCHPQVRAERLQGLDVVIGGVEPVVVEIGECGDQQVESCRIAPLRLELLRFVVPRDDVGEDDAPAADDVVRPVVLAGVAQVIDAFADGLGKRVDDRRLRRRGRRGSRLGLDLARRGHREEQREHSECRAQRKGMHWV